MSGSTPPGTQWLQQQNQRKRRRRAKVQQAATQDISAGDQLAMDFAAMNLSPEQQAQIQDLSDDQPALGAWQFQLSPSGEGQYDVIGSSPSEAEWGSPLNDEPMPLSDAIDAIQNYRTTAANSLGA